MSDNSDILNQISADQRKLAKDAEAPVAEKTEPAKGRTVKTSEPKAEEAPEKK